MKYKDKDLVWYHPVIDWFERYAAIVDGESWCLGNGIEVCNLNIVDPNWPHPRKRSNAVCLEAIERREN